MVKSEEYYKGKQPVKERIIASFVPCSSKCTHPCLENIAVWYQPHGYRERAKRSKEYFRYMQELVSFEGPGLYIGVGERARPFPSHISY